ncbi:MAG TPA: exodeoxyribonuclease VII small subunit [Rhodospirillales bacterium]|jgi:exodeoxyribonuclease VII small subunit|nr:exodeoxyribonuclease VII small subunit [Rhodospirillales bacterium]HJO68087.1 exodeoxyribonuclease VII small subunit [Rhodospirillales bacterium]
MTQVQIPPEIEKLSFEDALSELEKIVRRLEEGKGKLDEAIKAYERGSLLKRHCEAKLQEAQTRVEKIVLGPNGATDVEPLDVD